ncbi:MAG: hypothetical protein GWO23_22010, partial [Gammaproteobacteria bacterium]|nr:hypothetical protein [Gammaproteobacteria bacterium]
MRQLLSLIILCFSATLIHAQDLTDADIKKWVTAQQAITTWAKTTDIDEELDADKASDKPTDYSRIFSQMMERTAKSKHYDKLVEILDDNGYSDPEKWSAMGDRIMLAYMSNEMEGQEAQLKQQMQGMRAMMNNGQIPEAQKAMMEQVLQEGTNALEAAAKAPASDKKVVKRNEA